MRGSKDHVYYSIHFQDLTFCSQELMKVELVITIFINHYLEQCFWELKSTSLKVIKIELRLSSQF